MLIADSDDYYLPLQMIHNVLFLEKECKILRSHLCRSKKGVAGKLMLVSGQVFYYLLGYRTEKVKSFHTGN